MRFSKILTASFFIMALTLLVFAGGCAGSAVNGKPSPVVESTGPSQEKTSDPPAANQPSPKSAAPDESGQVSPEPGKTEPVIKAELGATPAEAKTPENKNNKEKPQVVYLTFDDGPNTFFTGKVLDILAEKNVKATFMVIGKNAEKNPDLIKRILAEGHGLANHTYSHDYDKVYKSPEAFIEDLDKANQVLASISSKPVMVFRAPGGPQHLREDFWEKLRPRGYISVGWNITSADSDPHGVTPQQEYDNILKDLDRVERLKRTPIVLMHDGTQLSSLEAKPGTAAAAYIKNRESTIAVLPEVIDLFKAKGYTFAVVDQNTPPAW